MQFLYGLLTCIGVSSLSGGRVFLDRSVEHTLPPDKLLTPMHATTPYKNCIYICLAEDEPTRLETRRRPVKN